MSSLREALFALKEIQDQAAAIKSDQDRLNREQADLNQRRQSIGDRAEQLIDRICQSVARRWGEGVVKECQTRDSATGDILYVVIDLRQKGFSRIRLKVLPDLEEVLGTPKGQGVGFGSRKAS